MHVEMKYPDGANYAAIAITCQVPGMSQPAKNSLTAHGPHPWAGDFDGDGKPDLLTCLEWSVYPLYRHAAIEMTERPNYKLSPVRSK